MKILVVGSVAYDAVETPAGKRESQLGGAATYFSVSASYFTEVGMIGVVMPEAPVGGSYSATVTVVDRVVDAASGTFGVRLELPNTDHALAAGLKCRVRF